MRWYNEPKTWAATGDTITVTADRTTDFWRKTHYGFIKDDGHFYYQERTGDFRCDVKVIGQYATLYDQAGLMVRVDETTWIKCGIEFVDGIQHVSAVVTRDFSDWSVVPLPGNPARYLAASDPHRICHRNLLRPGWQPLHAAPSGLPGRSGTTAGRRHVRGPAGRGFYSNFRGIRAQRLPI